MDLRAVGLSLVCLTWCATATVAEPGRGGTARTTAARQISFYELDTLDPAARSERRRAIEAEDKADWRARPPEGYRAVAQSARALDRAGRGAEARANEFMGALLVPPVPLHTRLLAHARSEGLRLCRGPHLGRPASPIVAASNGAEALAGVLAVLAGDFGVSEKFIDVRLSRYGLVEGGM